MSSVSAPFVAVAPATLGPYVDDPQTLVVDIRAHTAYAAARLPRALSLSVPSTLLRRPLFGLDRLAQMLPSPAARTRFRAFHQAPRILVYDADAQAIPAGSNIHGLLCKFKAAGFAGELAWLRGGVQAVSRSQLDTARHDDDDDTPDDTPGPGPPLRTKHLPMAAFSFASTTASRPTADARPATNPFFDTIRQNLELSHGITDRIPLRLPARVHRRIHDLPFPWLQAIARRADRVPDPLSPDHHLPLHSAPIDEGTEALAMQFYRIELAEQRRLMAVMEYHSKESGSFLLDRLDFHKSHANLVFPFSITAGVEKGAKNRYRHIWPFEHARVRLHKSHSNTTTQIDAATAASKHNTRPSPADLDDYVNASYIQPLGTNRRYIATQGPLEATLDDFWRLVWQQNVHVIVMLTKEIEGAMVKCSPYWSDTGFPPRERTFGPLTLTLTAKVGFPGNVDLMHPDLWDLEDPPRAHSASADASRSGFDFSMPSSLHPASAAASTGMGFDFHPESFSSNTHPNQPQPAGPYPHRSPHPIRPRITTIKRTFALMHAAHPHLGARTVVQLQYLGWPDMNVPDDARGVLELVREVESAVRETEGGGDGSRKEEASVAPSPSLLPDDAAMDPKSGIARHALGAAPVLLHCSAGVGRTGGFIAVDAVLDAVRREMGVRRAREREAREKAKTREKGADGQEGGAMDVDEVHHPSPSKSAGTQEREALVTVPLQVSGNAAGRRSSGAREDRHELVAHVPAVVAPANGGGSTLPHSPNPPTPAEAAGANPTSEAALRTPLHSTEFMQVDHPLPLPDTNANANANDTTLPSPTADSSGTEDSDAVPRPTELTRQWLDSHGPDARGIRVQSPQHVSTFAQPASTGAESVSPSSLSLRSPSSSRSPGSGDEGQSAGNGKRTSDRRSLEEEEEASSASASTFPSVSDSEWGVGGGVNRIRGGSGESGSRSGGSSLATSVSGGSAAGGGGGGDEKEVERGLGGRETLGLGASYGMGMGARTGRMTEHRENGPPGQGLGHRFRTFSAPQPPQPHRAAAAEAGLGSEVGGGRAKFPFTLGLGAGADTGASSSSPLARSMDDSALQQQLDRNTGMGIGFPSATVPHTPNYPPRDIPAPAPAARAVPVPVPVPSPIAHVPVPVPSSAPAARVNYKEPRALHGARKTPVALSAFEEPIWEVVQDMREQRMSLCQSLRQYVFVHAAVVEGALWLVDEERERERVEREEVVEKEKQEKAGEKEDEEMEVEVAELVEEEQKRREVEGGLVVVSPAPRNAGAVSFGDTSSSSKSRFQLHLPPTSLASLPPVPFPPPPQSSGVTSDSSTISSTGKRGASPTELFKENQNGEVLLSKRPSIERKLQIPSPDLEVTEVGNKPTQSMTGTLGTVPSSPQPFQ